MVALALSIVVPFCLGYLLVWRLWPSRPAPAWFLAVPALPAGWALTSVLFFFWTILSGGRAGWYPAVESLVLAAAFAALALARRRGGERRPALAWRLPVNRATAFTLLALLAAAGPAMVIAVKLAAINPWGYWDAWARINLKARFLFGGGAQWPWIFESGWIAQHDYPLLLPCTVARSWAWMGEVSQLAPQVLGLLWGAWLLVTLYGVLAWLRGPLPAAILGLACLTFTPLFLWASGQYADIPLACYLVLGCAMLAAAEKCPEEDGRFWFFAGLFAGAAAWCKNEGLAFLVLVMLWGAVRWFRGRPARRSVPVGGFIGGLSLAGGAVLTLKLAYAGKSFFFAGDGVAAPSALQLLADGTRHRLILDYLATHLPLFWNGWPLLLLAGAWLVHCLGRRRRTVHAAALAGTAALGAVYYLVLVTTPADLDWQLLTVVDRLLLQLWPLFLLGLGLLFDERELRGAETIELSP